MSRASPQLSQTEEAPPPAAAFPRRLCLHAHRVRSVNHLTCVHHVNYSKCKCLQQHRSEIKCSCSATISRMRYWSENSPGTIVCFCQQQTPNRIKKARRFDLLMIWYSACKTLVPQKVGQPGHNRSLSLSTCASLLVRLFVVDPSLEHNDCCRGRYLSVAGLHDQALIV